MARSVKKGPFIDKGIVKAVEKARNAGTRPPVIKTWSRRSTITQRQTSPSYLRYREYGWSQVGRVRPHADLQGTLWNEG